jgi:hypothetical protein
MQHDEGPEVVDLKRYKAAQAAAKAKEEARLAAQAKAARKARASGGAAPSGSGGGLGGSVLGGRRHAGLILAAIIAVGALLLLGPLFF